VWEFGQAVEAAMDEAEKHAGAKANETKKNLARQRALDEFLYAREEAPTKGRFRDPASVVRRGNDGRRPDREHPWNDQD
jgi:hypothetical protein